MAKNGKKLNKDKTNVLIMDKNISNFVSTKSRQLNLLPHMTIFHNKKHIILEAVKHFCLHSYNIENGHSNIPGWNMCLASLPKPGSAANEPLIEAEKSTKETCFSASLLD